MAIATDVMNNKETNIAVRYYFINTYLLNLNEIEMHKFVPALLAFLSSLFIIVLNIFFY